MLDLKRIRTNPEEVKQALSKRYGSYPIDDILALDEKRRQLLMAMEDKKAHQNRVSKEIPIKKKAGEDVTPIFAEMKKFGEQIKAIEGQWREVEEELNHLLLTVPNTPNPLVPEGKDDTENVELRRYLEPTQFPYEPKAHWDIGTDLGILEWERASKIAGTRFTLFKGAGARLERAIINFMLSLHTGEHGYMEVSPPFMVNRQAMTGTGQLPKFEDDMFHIADKDFFLIPTAEVPLTNLLRDEIVNADTLPLKLTAYTPCFRKEAGSAGRDTRGVIRNHQFDKVELVKFAHPNNSYDELESLTANAEEVLKRLKIPYRVVRLCSGDLGFSSAMTYDIEVWMPSYDRYVEISSCSNFEDFQARRANIRFRDEETKKNQFVHTLNGSGLAVGRTLAAILENYQQEDGSVLIPEVLQPFMGGQTHITVENRLR